MIPLVERDANAIEHEDGLALFISSEWRTRFRESLGNEKARMKLRRKLSHFRHLDHRFMTEVHSREQRSVGLARELRRRGAGDRCHIVSEDDAIDGRATTLDQSLREIVDGGSLYATFISCVPGRLAYFHDEEIDNRYILERRS